MTITASVDKYSLVAGSKAQDCPRDTTVALAANQEVCIMQGYSVAGTYSTKSATSVKLDKKHFPKLKRGVLSSTAKNVTGYFLDCCTVKLRFNDTITTKKGKRATYDFTLKINCLGFDTKKFAAVLKGIKYKPTAEKPVVSVAVVSNILGDAIKDAMKTILDQAPHAYYIPTGSGRSFDEVLSHMETLQASQEARAKTDPILFAFLQDKMLKLGIRTKIEI